MKKNKVNINKWLPVGWKWVDRNDEVQSGDYVISWVPVERPDILKKKACCELGGLVIRRVKRKKK